MKKIIPILLAFLFFSSAAFSKIRPLTLKERVDECQYAVLGKVIKTVSYWDEDEANIYTLHEIEIDGYWKGQSQATHIGLVDLGGQVGMHAQETNPAVRLDVGDYGVFMLGGTIDKKLQLKNYNASSPNFIQAFPTASIQGVILNSRGKWMDPSRPDVTLDVTAFFEELSSYTHQELIDPNGKLLDNRRFDISNPSQTARKTLSVTTLTDGNLNVTSTFNSGVSNNASMEMIINGSGFGSTTGTIEFPDANAGGGANTFTFPSAANQSNYGAPSDVISWTNTQIRIRVPRNAGTGTMEVFNSSSVSQGTAAITIDWSILPIYSSFFNFASTTSQFARLADYNSNGGYTYYMSSTGSANFFTNTAAKAAMKRAMDTWRCGTDVNFDMELNASTTTGFANDDTCIIIFDNSLPSGVLGRATSRYTANASGGCDMHDTYWRVQEMDLQFPTIPSAGYTWNYNTSGTTILQYSFETVALHEAGHAHGLGHVITTAKVMHYASSNGSENTTLAASDITAGTYKVTNSTSTPCLSGQEGPMVPLVAPCFALPLDLLSLTASAIGNHNEVRWTTEHESGLAHYEVEYSLDGIDFSPIGTVFAKNKKHENLYTYIHDNPQTNNSYYRLKITDIADKVSYSEVVLVTRNDRSDIAISPNPTQGELYINFQGTQLVNNIKYTITDLNGRVWKNLQVVVNGKSSRISEDISELSSGVYFIQFDVNGKLSTEKIIKQ